MPDSEGVKSKKIIGAVIVLSVLIGYAGIVYLVDRFAGTAGLAQWLNRKKVMTDHRAELMEKINRDPHFKDVDKERYADELEQIITMDKKRNLGNWVSYKSFTPNVSGRYIHTNDYGMRSSLSLREMVAKARANRRAGIRNIVFLGGSVAFGYGSVDDEQTITGFLNSMLKDRGYEVFNLAQGGFTSFMDLFMLATVGLYLEPNLIVSMESYADMYHLAYPSKGGELAWGLFSGVEREKDPQFAFEFHYHNLESISRLGKGPDRKVIIALQPVSGFDNNSRVEMEQIRGLWPLYPKIREVARLAAENNGAEFLDLSGIFKDDPNANLDFFDKAHLTVRGQRRVAEMFARTIENLHWEREEPPTLLKEEQAIAGILGRDSSGQYKTPPEYAPK